MNDFKILDLTPTDMGRAVVIYLVVQLAWWFVKAVLALLSKFFNDERTRIIRGHVRNSHADPLKYCLDPDCQPLRNL